MGNRNKGGYLQDLPTRATAAFQGAATTGLYVACVLVFVLHACLCLCRLLQRGAGHLDRQQTPGHDGCLGLHKGLVEAGPRVPTPPHVPLTVTV